MNMLLNILQNTGQPGLLSAMLCPMGGIALLVICGMMLRGRRVTPLLGAAFLAAPMGMGMLGVWLGDMFALEAVAHASAEMKMTLIAVGLSQVLYTRILTGGIAAALAGLTLVGCAIVGVRQKPRGKGIPAVVLVLTLLICAVVVAGGVSTGSVGTAAIRSLLYLFAGTLTAAALLSTDKTQSGTNAGSLAAIAFVVLIAGAEICSICVAGIFNFEAIARAGMIEKGTLATEWINVMAQQESFALGALAVAMVIAIAGATRSLEGSLRDVGVACALLYCLCAPLWLMTNGENSLVAFAKTLSASE